jgi:hypothetical protein
MGFMHSILLFSILLHNVIGIFNVLYFKLHNSDSHFFFSNTPYDLYVGMGVKILKILPDLYLIILELCWPYNEISFISVTVIVIFVLML